MTPIRSVIATAPTGPRDFYRMTRAVYNATVRPPVALAAGVAGFTYLSLFALPGNLAAIQVVVTSSLPLPRKVHALIALYPPFSPLYTPLDAVVIGCLVVLVAANVAVLAHLASADQAAESGGVTGVGMVGGILGAGCAACGSLIVPIAGVSATVAAMPLGGLELSIASGAVLLVVLSASSQRCEFDDTVECR